MIHRGWGKHDTAIPSVANGQSEEVEVTWIARHRDGCDKPCCSTVSAGCFGECGRGREDCGHRIAAGSKSRGFMSVEHEATAGSGNAD